MTKELLIVSLYQIQSASRVLVLPSPPLPQNSNKSFYSAFQNEVKYHAKFKRWDLVS